MAPQLTSVKSPLTNNPVSSLPGVVAEEVLDYGAINDEEQQVLDESEDENGGYLLPMNEMVFVLVPIYCLVFLASLDATVLSTLMTDIASDLEAIPYISWIATAYLLSTSIVQPLGKLSDIFGRKPSLLLCITIFTIGCLQCATASSVWSFSCGRFLSGFAAGLTALSTIIASDLVPLRARGVFQGLGNIFFAVGSALGGTLGGYISENWGWRAVFWCQVPIGICCFFVILFVFDLPTLPHEIAFKDVSLKDKLKKVDIWGIVLVACCLLLFITLTAVEMSTSTCFGVVALLIFGIYLLYKVECSHEFAIIPIELMSNRSVLGSSLANWFGTMYAYVLLYYFPVYLSTVTGLDSASVGLRLVPNIVFSSLSSIGSGYYMKWSGKYLMFVLIMMASGLFGLMYQLFRTAPGTTISTFEEFSLNILPISAYAGMLTVTLLSLIAAVPLEYQSSVTAIQYAFRSMGSTLGTSFSSYLFTSTLSKGLKDKLTAIKPDTVSEKTLSKIIDAALHDAKYIRSDDAPSWAFDAMVSSYSYSCWTTFIFSLIACAACLASLCMVKDNKLHTSVKR